MKGYFMKLLLPLLCSTVLMHASYTKMLHYYDKGEYLEAIKEAKKSFSEYDNPKLHLLWAKSAQKLGHIIEAMGAYERVMILAPENQEASKALSSIYKSTHREGLSVNPYEIPSRGVWRTKADLSIGYDTNVNANPGGDALDEYYGVVGNSGPLSSGFLRFIGDIGYTYHFNDSKKGWFIQSGLNIYNQSNFSAHFYDFLMGTITLATGYTGKNYTFYLPFNYNNIDYLDRNLMQRYQFLPRVIIPVFNGSYLDINANYTKREYRKEGDKHNDSNSKGVGAGIYFPIQSSLAHLNLNYEKRTSENDLSNQFIDADFITFDAGLKHSFNSSLYVDIAYTYRYGDYEDDIGSPLLPSLITRVDKFNEIDLKFAYLPEKNMELYLRNTYANNRSNYIPTEYNKNIFMFGMTLSY